MPISEATNKSFVRGMNDLDNDELQLVAALIVSISLLLNCYFIANRHCDC